MKPTFFASPAAWRAWLEKNHASQTELLVGFHKKHTERPSLSWSESVDQALCFGWIDGVRRSVDDDRYTIRFTPRKASSNWSRINIEKVAQLTKAGVMRPAGEAAFAARSEKRSQIYSYEQRHDVALTREQEKVFRAEKAAWEFFAGQPQGYRQVATYWVVSAKQEETRARRLAKLIDVSLHGKRLDHLTPRRRPKLPTNSRAPRHDTARARSRSRPAPPATRAPH